AFRLVTARNVVHAALYLVVTLAMVGGVYLILAAEFVAWVQILIYVGAIVILFLFGLMLTKAPIGREALDNQQRGIALLVGLGVPLFRQYVLPFEAVSFLLLAALIGAIVLSRKDERS